jgi:dephospho-CoA kinase
MKYAICGQMGSGKTTVSNYLVENYGFKRLSLAEPIYNIINSLEGHTSNELYDLYIRPLAKDKYIKLIPYIDKIREIPNEKPKPRKRLQMLGTEYGRNEVADDIWIDLLLLKALTEPLVVVDDLRFHNEFSALKTAGFKTIRLNVPYPIRLERLLNLYGKDFDTSRLNHASELDVLKMSPDFELDAGQDNKFAFKQIDEILKRGS